MTCYMCSEQATSKEHCPPKCLFPEKKNLSEGEDQRVNLIKVPSCILHNTEKSGDDEYLLYLFSMSEKSNSYGKINFHNKVTNSVSRRPKLAMKLLIDDVGENGEFTPEIDRERINKSISQIARGIFYFETGLKWFAPMQINSTSFNVKEEQDGIQIDRKNILLTRQKFFNQTSDYLADRPWKGQNPESFKYKLLLEDNRLLLVSLVFYEGIDFQVLSHPDIWNLDFGV